MEHPSDKPKQNAIHPISFRINDQEFTALSALVQIEDRSVSNYFRVLIKQEAQKRGLWPASAQPPAIRENAPPRI